MAEPVFTSKVLLSIIGGLLTALFGMSSWVWSQQSDRIGKVETAQENKAERTSRLEGEVDNIKAALARIEGKLDGALEGRRHP